VSCPRMFEAVEAAHLAVCLDCQHAGRVLSEGAVTFPAQLESLKAPALAELELVSNAVGNFYSAEPLEPPLQMETRFEGRTMVMPVTAPTGGCALCHSWPEPVEAAGRIRAP
jgi:hypothetical protein